MNNIWILADAAGNGGELESTKEISKTTDGAQGTATKVTNDDPNALDGAKTSPAGPEWMKFAPMAILFIVMYFLLIKGPKKKQQKHTQMVGSIQKNDRIQTIGGIIGTVINTKDNEIVIKIDESNNTKMTISKGAVSKVLSDEIK